MKGPSLRVRPAMALATLTVAMWGCASGSQVRLRAAGVREETEKARRAGAARCAPRELATAMANLEFVQTELSQGSSLRANQHLHEAETAARAAREASKDCAPKVASAPKREVVRIEEVDTDGDGRIDTADTCPREAGPLENDGCPVSDRDKDGIADTLDGCPDQAGSEAEKGCPASAKTYKTVVVEKKRIQIKEQIRFGPSSGRIVGQVSSQVLDDVAAALRDNPQIQKIRIEGHTDSVGGENSNLRLSQRRADSVKRELQKRGIDRDRLEAVGFGETQPIASNSTSAGRAENRRTEFNIIEQ